MPTSDDPSTTCAYDAHEEIIGYRQVAPKRPTNVTLDEELVRQVRLLTPNLSGTVEDLLRGFVAREQSRPVAEDAAAADLIGGFNAFHRENGLLSDEFSSL